MPFKDPARKRAWNKAHREANKEHYKSYNKEREKKRLRIGNKYYGFADTPEQAAQLNALASAMLREFKVGQKNRAKSSSSAESKASAETKF